MTPRAPYAAAGIQVERRTSIDGLQALVPEWLALLPRSPGTTPFQRPEWLLPWYRVFAPDHVHALAARDPAGRLVALLPAVDAGPPLTLAGDGVSDYRGAIVDGSAAIEAMATIRAALDGDDADCEFDDLPADSAWLSAFERGSSWRAEPACVCPVVPLPRTAAEWRDGLPAGLDRNMRRYGRRLQDDAGARYETVAQAAGVEPALDALFRLHSRRWHDRGELGVLQSGSVRRFHDLSASALFGAGVLRLHLLYAGSQIIAAQYVLVDGGRAYSYISGFDPEWGRYGPGTLLMAHAVASAIDEGCTELDLLRGVEPYKYVWGAVNRTSVRLIRRGGADGR